MSLRSIYVSHFRNYKAQKIDFSPALTIFVGENGQGKTNILEAITLLSRGQSFRTSKRNICVQWDHDITDIQGLFVMQDRQTKISFRFGSANNRMKTIKIDDQPVPEKDFFTLFRTVVFEPEDLNMITHEPQLRRKFLDHVLIQSNISYKNHYAKLQKIVPQRNKILEAIACGKANVSQLLFWDEQLQEIATEICFQRMEFLDFCQDHINDLYSSIAGDKMNIHLKYMPFFHHGETIASEVEDIFLFKDRNFIQKKISETMQSLQSREIAAQHTLCGPQRDDFLCFLRNYPFRDTASRGECRSLVIVLKMLETQYVYKKTNIYPILLLDDVFSELDHKRRAFLCRLFPAHQVIMTTTDISHISPFSSDSSLVYTVNQGSITQLML